MIYSEIIMSKLHELQYSKSFCSCDSNVKFVKIDFVKDQHLDFKTTKWVIYTVKFDLHEPLGHILFLDNVYWKTWFSNTSFRSLI